MNRIDEALVRHMAHLSRLALTDDEVAHFTQQLRDILEYASHLPELPESQSAAEHRLTVAEDTVQLRTNPHDLLRNATAMENGFVKVPAILDRSEDA